MKPLLSWKPLLLACAIAMQFATNDGVQASSDLQVSATSHLSSAVSIPNAAELNKLSKKTDSPQTLAARKVRDDQEQVAPIVEEIKVYADIEPEDFKKLDKTPIAKLRTFLDKNGKSSVQTIRESIGADGSRAVRISSSMRTYYSEESRGQVDWLDSSANKLATNCWGRCR